MICCFRAALPPLHSVVNWPAFTIYICFLLLRYNLKSVFKRFLNFEKGHVDIAEIWRFLNF